MIDSIIFYGAGSKVGTRLTALTDAKADAVVSRFVKTVEDGNDEFDGSQVTRVEIITKQAVVDAEGNVVSPRETLAGFGALIATDNQEAANAIWNLPDNVCRAQFDRASGKLIRARVPLATLRTLSFEPMFAGSNYDFSKIERV